MNAATATIVPPVLTQDVLLKTTLACADGPRMQGRVYAEPIDTAAEWIRNGIAIASPMPPKHVADLLARLDDGAGRACVFLPFVGEFGHLLMSHVRIVHFHRAMRKIVCCRPGEEVLFPSAGEFVTDWTDPVVDRDRIATMRDRTFEWPELRARFAGYHFPRVGQLTPKQEIHPINPARQIPFRRSFARDPKLTRHAVDVVFGIRRRAFCPERNWQHWPILAQACRAAGLTYAVIGARETSFDLDGQITHSAGNTDAAIGLLENCRLYIGTDSGNSHLAAAVGVPMLLFRETVGGSRDLTGVMSTVNRCATWIVPNGWTEPTRVVEAMRALLFGESPQ